MKKVIIELKQIDYIKETENVAEYSINENNTITINRFNGLNIVTHKQIEGAKAKKLNVFENVDSLLSTDVDGLIIVNNSKLYDCNKGEFITKNFHSIGAIGGKNFFVTDKITVDDHHSDAKKTDCLMFQLDDNLHIVSHIYSTISHDWIAYPAGNKEFDYYNFIESRKNFLHQLEEKEISVMNRLKRK